MTNSYNDAIKSFSEINTKLFYYDFIISPYYTPVDLVLLKQSIENAPLDCDKVEKEKISELIAERLYQLNMNFSFRAHLIVEGYMEASWFKHVSHIVEIGMIEFYKFNFITCIAVWFPLVEGIIREILHIPLGKMFNRIDDINKLKLLKPNNVKNEYFLEMLISQLSDYLQNVFYKKISTESDIPAHNFNRHFIGHYLSTDSYYYSINCLKLLSIFDLLLAINFLVDSEFNAFFNDTNDKTTKRIIYYEIVLKDSLSEINLQRTSLLTDHHDFKPERFFGK